MIANLIPKTSSTPNLAHFTVQALLLSALNVAASAAVASVNHVSSHTPIPKFLKFIFFQIIGYILCKSCHIYQAKKILLESQKSTAKFSEANFQEHQITTNKYLVNAKEIKLNLQISNSDTMSEKSLIERKNILGSVRKENHSVNPNNELPPRDGDRSDQNQLNVLGPNAFDHSTRNLVHSENWQELASILNRLCSIIYIVWSSIIMIIYLLPLIFNNQKCSHD